MPLLCLDEPSKEAMEKYGSHNDGKQQSVDSGNKTASKKPVADSQQKETKPIDLTPRPFDGDMQPFYRDGTIVFDKDGNLGHLRDVTEYGATFHPLELNASQTGRTSVSATRRAWMSSRWLAVRRT